MRNPKLITNYQSYSDARLDVKAQAIVTALTNNVNFPETVPSLANFTSVTDVFANALTTAASRDRVAISLKNDARRALLENLRLLAVNIDSLAMGDRTKLVSSGFDLAGEAGGSSSLMPPQDFMLSDGTNSGEIKFTVKAVANAKSYIFEYTLEPLNLESTWVSKGSSKREFVFANLPISKRIYGKVTAIGTRGKETSSIVISRIVQ